MTVSLSPLFNAYQGFTSGGLPLSGGLINTYIAGSTTPQVTYTSSTGLTPNSNPIILGADGRTSQEIWLTDGVSYKFVLTDSIGNLIGTYDNIQSAGTVAANTLSSLGTLTTTIADGRYPIYSGAAGGSADTLSATLATGITALYNGLMIEIDAAYPNTTATPTLNLTLGTTVTGAKTIYKFNGLPLSAGDISGAGHRIVLTWSSTFGGWMLINPVNVTQPYTTQISTTGGTTTLTTQQYSASAIEISGALTSNAIFIVPNNMGLKSFENITSGNFTVTVTTLLGSGFIIPPGNKYLVYTNGTNAEVVAPSILYSTAITPLPSTAVLLSYTHGLGYIPADATLEAVCLANDSGYVTGDIVIPYTQGGATFATPFVVAKNASSVFARTGGYNGWAINNGTTGIQVLMTAANWAYRFKLRPI